jgi:hypothetical protein
MQKRQIMGGHADAPAGKHPDEPDVVGMTVNVDRGERSDHHHEDAKVDDKPRMT